MRKAPAFVGAGNKESQIYGSAFLRAKIKHVMAGIETAIVLFLYHLGLSIEGLVRFLGSYLPTILVIVFIIGAWRIKDRAYRWYVWMVALLVEIVSRGILAQVLQLIIPRQRPFMTLGVRSIIENVTSSSFPSGHAVFIFGIVCASFLINKKFGWAMTIGGVLVVLARVAGGIHWTSDILAGTALAVGTFFLVIKMLPKKRFEKREEVLEEEKVDVLQKEN